MISSYNHMNEVSACGTTCLIDYHRHLYHHGYRFSQCFLPIFIPLAIWVTTMNRMKSLQHVQDDFDDMMIWWRSCYEYCDDDNDDDDDDDDDDGDGGKVSGWVSYSQAAASTCQPQYSILNFSLHRYCSQHRNIRYLPYTSIKDIQWGPTRWTQYQICFWSPVQSLTMCNKGIGDIELIVTVCAFPSSGMQILPL